MTIRSLMPQVLALALLAAGPAGAQPQPCEPCLDLAPTPGGDGLLTIGDVVQVRDDAGSRHDFVLGRNSCGAGAWGPRREALDGSAGLRCP